VQHPSLSNSGKDGDPKPSNNSFSIKASMEGAGEAASGVPFPKAEFKFVRRIDHGQSDRATLPGERKKVY
jgi:hypothetical protein